MAPSASGVIRYVIVTVLAGMILAACGSTETSECPNGGGGPETGTGPGTDPGFNIPDGGRGGQGSGVCKPRTCAEQGVECGPAGDGCSGVIASCGTCAPGLRCG